MRRSTIKGIIAGCVITLLCLSLHGCSLKMRYGLYSGLQLGELPIHGNGPTLAEELGYTKDDVLLIVHADDIAMHVDQTDGTLDLMARDMVTSGSVMVPCPDYDRLAGLWKKNPSLDLGIHLTLNSDWGEPYAWSAVLPKHQVPSLHNDKGNLWRTPRQLMAHMDVDEALLELEAQIRKVLDAGLRPTHMDGHYGNYYMHAALAEGVAKLSRKYNLPMKPPQDLRARMRSLGYVFPDTMWMFFKLHGEATDPRIRKQVYDAWMRELTPGVHEIVIHSSYMSDEWSVIVGRFNTYLRRGDYDYWSSPETKALAEELGIIFIGYRELQVLQARNWGLDPHHFKQ